MALVRMFAAITAALGVALAGLMLIFFKDPDLRLSGWTSLAIAGILLGALFFGPRRKRALHRARVAYENGLLYYDRCQLAKASRYLHEAVAIYAELQEWEGQALAFMEIGNCENDAGHH